LNRDKSFTLVQVPIDDHDYDLNEESDNHLTWKLVIC